MGDVKNDVEREPYEAPAIEDIPLRAEEQSIRGCKQGGGSGVGVPRPTGCTILANCTSVGTS